MASALVGLMAGCQVRGQSGVGGSAPREGYCRLAELMPLHPLYADLETLDREVRALRMPEVQSAPTGLDSGAAQPEWLLAGPSLLIWPQDDWLAQRGRAAAGLTAQPPLPSARLPLDLEAELAWKRRQAEAASQARVRERESKASRELSAAVSDLYRKNQERLTEPRQGETREQVTAELEKQVAMLQKAHDEQAAQLEKSLQESAQAQIAEAERAAQRQAEDRRQTPGGDVSALDGAFRLALESFPAPQWPGQVAASLLHVELPAPDAGAVAHTGAESERAAARERQAATLAARRDQITSSIMAAGRIAAEKVARDRAIRLHYVPDERPTGSDVTAEIRDGVREMWAGTTP